MWIRNWDIDRQSVYRYRKPLFLPRGTTLHMRYTYDNSAANVHNPNDPPIRVRAGNRSTDEMGHLWLQVLPVNQPPDVPDPRLLLEEAWMRNKLRKQPTDTLALFNLAGAEMGERRYSDAVTAYTRELALQPDDARAWTALGAAYEKNGDTRRAREALQKAVTVDPANTDAAFDLARLDLDDNEAVSAESQFRAILKQRPDDAGAHSGLGLALLKQQQSAPAEAEFQHALELDPEDVTAVEGEAQLAMDRGQPAQAVGLLEAGVKKRGEDPDFRERLAMAYAQTGRFGDALTQLKAAAAIVPNDPGVHALLAQVLSTTGQQEAAIIEQQEALRLDATDADGWNNLGVLEIKAGKSAQARTDFEHALRLAPNHEQAKSNLQRLRAERSPQ